MGPAPSNPRIDLGTEAWRCLGPAYQIASAMGPGALSVRERPLGIGDQRVESI